MTWKETWRLLRADLRRRLELEGCGLNPLTLAACLLHRGTWAAMAYRVNHYLLLKGWRRFVRLSELLFVLISRSEIHAGAEIGPGLVITDRGGVGVPAFARIGRNCCFLGPSLLTLGAVSGVDLSQDHIILGDHCVIGPGARLLGAIRLGHGIQVKANSVVITSFEKPGQIVAGIPARRRGTVALETVQRWNPWRAEWLSRPAAPSY